MVNEFSRTELLMGGDALERIKHAVVMVFGVGGVGSHCIEALARCGVGKLILIDNDTVSLTNINRQSIAYHSTIGQYKTKVMKKRIADISPEIQVETHELFVLPENLEMINRQSIAYHSTIGQYKTKVMKKRIADISPEIQVETHELFVLPENLEMLFSETKPDYIVDAIDTVTAKLALVELAQRQETPIISSMGTGNKLHAELFEITDLAKTSVCPLCKVMRKELKARGITHLKVLYSKEKPVDISDRVSEEEKGKRRALPGSVSFVPPVAGILIAGEVLREIGGVQ